MNTQPIYLALYRGRRDGTGWLVWLARATDWLTRVLTRGRYSHCELAVRLPETAGEQEYECYSASIRDKGVRCIAYGRKPKAKATTCPARSAWCSDYLKTAVVGFAASGWARRWGWPKAGVFRRTI